TIYVRAATAWAFNASSANSAGISEATTEMTYCSNGTFSTSLESVRSTMTSRESSVGETDSSTNCSSVSVISSGVVPNGNFTMNVGKIIIIHPSTLKINKVTFGTCT